MLGVKQSVADFSIIVNTTLTKGYWVINSKIMKKLVFLIATLFMGSSFAQEIDLSKDSALSKNVTFKNGLYLYNELAYTGKYLVYYSSGLVKEELNIKGGLLSGDAIKYYENGAKMEVRHFENNLKFGLWASYSNSGTLTAEASYKNDKKDGVWTIYSEKGAKLFKMEYTNGEKTGTWVQWDENGEMTNLKTYVSL